MTTSVLIDRCDGVVHIVLRREQRRNALNREVCNELLQALEKAEFDPDVGVVLISAEGPVFCAGLDLDEAAQDSSTELDRLFGRLFVIRSRITKPIVMAIQGAALGGGLGLAASAHFVIADERAVFGLPEINLGMWPYLVFDAVSEVIGNAETVRLALLGTPISAEHAQKLGLVFQIVPAAELQVAATTLAQSLASKDRTALARGLAFSSARMRGDFKRFDSDSAVIARQRAKRSRTFLNALNERRKMKS